MKITTLTGSATQNNIRVQKPAQRLLIVKSGGAAFNAEMLSLKLTRKNGRELQIIQNTYIKEVLPFVQFGNGFNPVLSQNYVAVVEIADGSPVFNNGDEYVLDFSGLTTNVNYDVYAIGSPIKVNHTLKYNRSSVQASQTSKEFSTEGAKLICISQTALTGLTMVSRSSELINVTATELQALDLINSDVAFFGLTDTDTGSSPLFVQDAYFLVNVENIERLVIDTDGSADCPYVLLSWQELA